jgi:hypothetical protein
MKPRPADDRSLGVLSTFAAPGRDDRTLSRATKTPPPFAFTRSLYTKKPSPPRLASSTSTPIGLVSNLCSFTSPLLHSPIHSLTLDSNSR